LLSVDGMHADGLRKLALLGNHLPRQFGGVGAVVEERELADAGGSGEVHAGRDR
jgi:hypothetical protein